MEGWRKLRQLPCGLPLWWGCVCAVGQGFKVVRLGGSTGIPGVAGTPYVSVVLGSRVVYPLAPSRSSALPGHPLSIVAPGPFLRVGSPPLDLCVQPLPVLTADTCIPMVAVCQQRPENWPSPMRMSPLSTSHLGRARWWCPRAECSQMGHCVAGVFVGCMHPREKGDSSAGEGGMWM